MSPRQPLSKFGRSGKQGRRFRVLVLLVVSALVGLLIPWTQPALAGQPAAVPTFLDVEPETDTNPDGTTHTFTVNFTDQFGDPIDLSEAQLIDFEIISGPNANTQPGFRDFECPSNSPTQGGTCTASYTDAVGFDANNATDTICAWISNDGDDDQYDPNGSADDGGDCDAETPNETEQGTDPNAQPIPGDEGNDQTDVVQKTWEARRATFLDVDPETDSNPNGTQHFFTVNFTDQTGAPINLSEGQLIDFEIISGPNEGLQPGFRDFECPSNDPTQGGTCTASYQDGQAFDETTSTDTICAWISNDGDDDIYDPNGAPEDGGDCDAETRDETEQGVDHNGNNIPGDEGNDITDVVQKTWLEVHTLSVTVATADGATGSVTGNGIDCPGDCTEGYVEGTEVTLTAHAADGSGFSGWSGACTNWSGECVVTMDEAKSVTATFSPALGRCANAPAGANVIVGTSGDDNIQGSEDADLICGAAGRDVIHGNGGGDDIYGDTGRDELRGGRGADNVFGGASRDLLIGNGGNDTLLVGNGYSEEARGGSGDDFIRGGIKHDVLFGGFGDDTLVGRAGDDYLNGGRDVDECRDDMGDNIFVGCES